MLGVVNFTTNWGVEHVSVKVAYPTITRRPTFTLNTLILSKSTMVNNLMNINFNTSGINHPPPLSSITCSWQTREKEKRAMIALDAFGVNIA